MANDIVITPGSARIDFSGASAQTVWLDVAADGTVSIKGANGTIAAFVDSATPSLEVDGNPVYHSGNPPPGGGLDIHALADTALVSGDEMVFADASASYALIKRTSSSFLSDFGVWTSNNDGAASGLDADLLDGQHGSYYLDLTNSTGDLPAARFTDTSHGSRSGGSLHANATTSVAGFMSASDKTKLDGIESGATADMTASEVLAALLTVDGASSALDADLLDGQHGSHYLDLANSTGDLPAARFTDTSHGSRSGGSLHADATTSVAGFMSASDKTKLDGIESGATTDMTASEILAALLTVDGAGSGLDADTLDGISSASFSRSDAAQSISAIYTFTSTNPAVILDAAAGNNRFLRFSTASSTRAQVGINSQAESGSGAGSTFVINLHDDSGTYLSTPFSASRTADSNPSIASYGAATNTARGLSVAHYTSSTAAIGFGAALSYAGEDEAGTAVTYGAMNVVMTDATAGSVDTDFILYLMDAGSLTERFRVTSDGATSTTSFLAADGSAGAPTMTFTNYQTSGLFAPGAGLLGLTAGGTERLRLGTTSLVSGAFDWQDNILASPVLQDAGWSTVNLGNLTGSVAADYESGPTFYGTTTGTTTWSFTNPPASGTTGVFRIILTNGGSQTQNWPGSVSWHGGSAPALSASGVDVLEFTTRDGGTTYYGRAIWQTTAAAGGTDLNSLTTDATGGLMADYLGFVDVSDSNASNKVLVSDFLYNALNDATADTAPDMSADHVLTRDSSASAVKKVLLKYVGAGKQTLSVPSGAMVPRTTNGAAINTLESTTNKIMRRVLDFDQSTAEYAQFAVAMPKNWNLGTVTAEFVWEATATGNVVWGIMAVAISDDDAYDAAFGSAQTVTDGVTATTDFMISAETSAVTIGGTPAAGDTVVFEIYRDAANGSDTLAADARLIAVRIKYTTQANTDD